MPEEEAVCVDWQEFFDEEQELTDSILLSAAKYST